MYKLYYNYNVGNHTVLNTCALNRQEQPGLLQRTEFKKWLMRINFTCILLFFAFMQSALATRAQKISLSHKNVSIETVFEDIRKQSGYDFIYPKNLVKNSKLISIQANNEELRDVLIQLFQNQSFTYALENRTIVVKEREKTMTERIRAYFLQPIDVKGKVLGQDGEPLAGASIQVKGHKIMSLTDRKGEFNLKNLPENSILVISYVGYVSKEIKIGTRAIDLGAITLVMSMSELSEVALVINTGYQTISQERVTGSYGVVTGKKLEARLATNLKSALEGQLTGVVLDKKGNIEIRGVSTFGAEKNPLVVVDGYPIEGGIENVNPLNISSVTVLKDGVSASIYGSRAANGVIVIATKAGINGGPRLTYNGLVNFVSKPNLRDLNRSSTSDYIDAELDLFRQDPNDASTVDKGNMSRVTYLMMQVRENKISEADAMAEINRLRNVDGLQQFEDQFFRPEISNQHNFNISGATEKNSYNVALNLLNRRENFIQSNSNRLILDVKNDWKPFKFLTAGVTVNVVYNNRLTPYNDYTSMINYNSASILQPYTNLVDENGNPAAVWGLSQYKVDTYKKTPGMKGWTNIPLNDLSMMTRRTQDFQTRLGGFLRANIVEGLTAEFGGSWQRGSMQVKELRDVDSYAVRIAYNDATSLKNTANHYLPDGSIIDESRNINENWTIRSQLNYNHSFNNYKHRITALVGNEVRKLTFDNNRIETRVGYNSTAGSFVPMNLKDYNAGVYTADMLMGRQISLNAGKYEYRDNRFVSWYGNASYEYDNRFILSGSIRMDLTNFFGTDPKYRYRPLWSVGGTYKLAEEPFLKNDWMSRLNLRASYGVSGNISLNQGPFLILSTGSFNNTTGGVSYGVASPPNNQLRWERTNIVNFGIDFAGWNNRFNASIDYYTKNSTDLLAAEAADPTSGFATVTKNAGEMSNSGVELALNVDLIRSNNFRWNMGPNISYNYNKVKTYNVVRNYASSYAGANGILVAGYPADGLWGYRFAGLSNLGETQIYNAANKVIKPGDAVTADVAYLGTLRPKFDLSLNNTFTYKNWDLTMLFISKLGHKYRKDNFSGSNYLNRHVAERWQKPGDENNTIYPVLNSWNMDMFYFPYVDALIGNASYVKLRDLTLSYNFEKFAKKLKMSNAKVFVQGRNLFRITAKGTDIDPETAEVNTTGGTGAATEQGFTSLPLPRELFFGVTFSF
ncbi:MAG: SusC/RagA family TonB-linked outer membrane protein [Candidatus Pedobacter colombiensis]|uniref:SusC/RagA family TonB-linked outer membrane protein n=1 Tax=Candidatus Pedobacter colombiensis TaxID=3121371 RepID=A0AAJ5W4M1_9SPHI|nr:SusC/RagA family TonB-linked outer membrane protein [Pedobacter sp.]WEK18413.1 MAG: SusC/RagA family TonB-linked outer membrane protein [Pedobacter sp.]